MIWGGVNPQFSETSILQPNSFGPPSQVLSQAELVLEAVLQDSGISHRRWGNGESEDGMFFIDKTNQNTRGFLRKTNTILKGLFVLIFALPERIQRIL